MENGSTKNAVADNNNGVNNPTPPPAGEPDPVTEADWIRGSADAQLILIEYSDLECPYCKQFHQTVTEALEQYDETELAWVYRHFPLEQLHPKAITEAIAAECVGKLGGQEAFWDFVDIIFEVTPANNRLDLEKLPDYAAQAGVNVPEFQTCLDNEETRSNVEEDLASGQAAGVRGTPGSFLLNTETGESQYIPGALPLSQLQSQIDAMLN